MRTLEQCLKEGGPWDATESFHVSGYISLLEKDNASLRAQLNLSDITRVEVIDKNGRAYVNNKGIPLNVEQSIQDAGRTLKLFVEEK